MLLYIANVQRALISVLTDVLLLILQEGVPLSVWTLMLFILG